MPKYNVLVFPLFSEYKKIRYEVAGKIAETVKPSEFGILAWMRFIAEKLRERGIPYVLLEKLEASNKKEAETYAKYYAREVWRIFGIGEFSEEPFCIVSPHIEREEVVVPKKAGRE
jgi:hypothetical protein